MTLLRLFRLPFVPPRLIRAECVRIGAHDGGPSWTITPFPLS